jgi:hypothetical protein
MTGWTRMARRGHLLCSATGAARCASGGGSGWSDRREAEENGGGGRGTSWFASDAVSRRGRTELGFHWVSLFGQNKQQPHTAMAVNSGKCQTRAWSDLACAALSRCP